MSAYRLQPLPDCHSASDFHEATRDALIGPALDGSNPVGDNYRRAAFAAEALNTYGARTGVGSGESVLLAVSDLLSDLRHLLDLAAGLDDDAADGYPRTLDALAQSGSMHYEAEVRG